MAKRNCAVSECGRPHYARGWCSGHYARWFATGEVRPDVPLRPLQARRDPVCTVPGCSRPHLAQGYCVLHYRRWQEHGDALYAPTPLAERFWSRVSKGDGCWVWQSTRTDSGYGVISVSGRQCRAHRIAWELEHGEIPAGYEVCHRCDNPPCVNPAHLFLGTHDDNHRDKINKGRQARAGRHGQARLTAEQVADIRTRCELGETRSALAREYGVSVSQVCRIALGQNWREAQ